MADIGIKIETYSNIAAVVKALRGYSAMSISEIKAAVEKKDYVCTGSSYDDGDLEKLIDCYKKITQAGIEAGIYEEGEPVSLDLLLNLRERNSRISNEIEAEMELELDDTDIDALDAYFYLWEDESGDWVVIKDGYEYTIYNTKTMSALSVEDEELNNKIAAMMIMQGCEVREE